MKAKRIQRITFSVVGLVLLALVGFGFVYREDLVASWYILRLSSSDAARRIEALRELGRLRSWRAVPHIARRIEGAAERASYSVSDPAVGEKRNAVKEEQDAGIRALIQIGKPSVKALVSLLKASDASLRDRSAEAIIGASLPPQPLMSALLDAVDGREEYHVFYVLVGLLKKEPASHLRVLLSVLQGRDVYVWNRVLNMLVTNELEGKDVAPLLLAASKHPDAEVRCAATQPLALTAHFDDVEGAVVALEEALADPSPSVRSSAAAALEMIPEKARRSVPALLRALSDSDRWVSEQAALTLERVDPTALVQTMQTRSPEVQIVIASVLGTGRVESAVDVLVNVARTGETLELRAAAVDALRAIGVATDDAVRLLCSLVAQKDGNLRYEAALALGGVKAADPEAVRTLIRALGDEDTALRQRAALALQMIGPDAEPAVEALVEALADEEVAGFAADALGAIGSKAVPRLVKLLGDERDFMRWAAAESLGRCGSAAKEATTALVGAANDESSRVRYHALQALDRIVTPPDDEAFVEALRESVADPDPTTRFLAARLLARRGGEDAPEAIAPLCAVMRDQTLRTAQRLWALEALENLKGRAVEPLIEILSDPEPYLRQRAAESLGSIGAPARSAVGDLTRLLDDPDAGVRYWAEQALRRLRPTGAEAPVNETDPTAN